MLAEQEIEEYIAPRNTSEKEHKLNPERFWLLEVGCDH